MSKEEVIYRMDYQHGAIAALHAREIPNSEARFAMALVERWGLVTGEADGEDSAGRAKLRHATADELAARACDASAALFQKFRDLGWMIEVPDYEVVRDAAREEKKRN